MSIQPIIDKQVQQLERLVEQTRKAGRFRRAGTVVEISGLTIVARGPAAQIGELCALQPDGGNDPIYAQVVAFRENHTILLTLGSLGGSSQAAAWWLSGNNCRSARDHRCWAG